MSSPVKQAQGKSAAEVFQTMTSAHEDHSLAITEAAAPWWFRTPSVLLACARLALFPLEVAIRAAEALMAGAILAVVAVAYLWWIGAITDAQVAAWLTPVGERILAMVEKAAG